MCSRKRARISEVEPAKRLFSDLRYVDAKLQSEFSYNVDHARNVVTLPMFETNTSVHICSIKSVEECVKDESITLHINFTRAIAVCLSDRVEYVREVEYIRCNNILDNRESPGYNLCRASSAIQEVCKKMKHHKLTFMLENLNIYPRMPNIGMGSLEVYPRGVVFSHLCGIIEVEFHNIKRAFFSPSDGERTALLHFHLHRAMYIENRECLDIQFYLRLPKVYTDTVEFEINQKFQMFCQTVEKLVEFRFKFYSVEGRGFIGHNCRTQVFFQIVQDCAINLIEFPMFVVALVDVDHVQFESIDETSEQFNMVFTFIDKTRQAQRIEQVLGIFKADIEDWLKNHFVRISHYYGDDNLFDLGALAESVDDALKIQSPT